MANERYEDKYEGQEEGEYHFADDQVNYEMEPEAAKETVAAPVVKSPQENVIGKVKEYRRVLIGVVAFIVLLAISYKIFVPAAPTTPTTDFDTQNAAANQPVRAAKTPAQLNQPVIPVPAARVAQQQPVQAALAATAAAPTETMAPQQAATPAAAPSAAPTMVMTGSSSQSAATQPPAGAPQAITTMPPTTTTPPPTPVSVGDTQKALPDRVTTLEQQNLAMMNLLQTQYAQKIADYETQNAQMRNQIQELNTRIAGMEVAFHQLTKILRNGGMNKSIAQSSNGMSVDTMRVTSTSSSRMMYTVQAIIPGRAWLKSDSGDTVTVAEGDVLRDLGKITKIDPYDGIVNIDTGKKIITLTYGASGD